MQRVRSLQLVSTSARAAGPSTLLAPLALWVLLALWALLALTGCQTAAVPPQTASPAGTPDPGQALARSGKLSVSVADDAARSMSSAFELTGDAERGALVLISPLGTHLASAQWQPGRAVLRTGQGDQVFDTLRQLSQEVFGQDIPLDALPAWLLGQPWRGAPHEALPNGEAGFTQMGWTVSLARWAEGWLLATRPQAPVLRVRAKLDAAPDPSEPPARTP